MEIPTLTFSSFSLIPRKSYSKGKLIALLVKQSYNKANARNLSKVWYAVVLKSFFKYWLKHLISRNFYFPTSVQFSSVAQSCLTLCDSMNCWKTGPPSITNSQSSPKLISIESMMPSSHLILCRPLLLLPLIPPSISLLQWVNSSHEVAKVLEFQPQHQSFQWTPRTGLL